MALYQTRPFKRGDIYYITYDGALGSEIATGRPAIIVSSDAQCGTNPVLSVVYLTTREQHSVYPWSIEINATKRQSWALCEQITTVDKLRMKNYCATASPEEMAAVDKAMATCLGIPYGIVTDTSAVDAVKAEKAKVEAELAETENELHKKDEKVFELMAERDYYKRLYDAALGRFVENRLDKDLSRPILKAPRMVPDEPEEEEPKPVAEVHEAEKKIDLNTCSVADLKAAGMKNDMIVRVMTARPFKKAEDLRAVPGMTKIAWQLLQHKVTVEQPVKVVKPVKPAKPVEEKPVEVKPTVAEEKSTVAEAKPERVNVNTATVQEIMEALGTNKTVAYCITGYRKKNGPFAVLDDLEDVPRVSKKIYRKALEVLTV